MRAAAPSSRTTVRRSSDRGVYDRAASRMLRALVAGAPIADPELREHVAAPVYAQRYERARRGEG